MMGSMATATTHRVDWRLLLGQRAFRFFFTAMFVSLFGSGMNFIGVSWYIMSATHSTVAVSWQVIVVTLPGLVVPFLGGVLIDRYDRRYLGVLLDLARGFAVLAISYIAWHGHLQLWHLYFMTLITGTGSAMYWANVNALVQEVIPPSQFTGANATVLVGVQTGMLLAGTFVGFMYDHAGIGGILFIDGLTYFVSAYCLYSLRSGYVSPLQHRQYPREFSESAEGTAQALESGENPEVAEAGLSLAVYTDMKAGWAYLRKQPVVLALGITHAMLMASIVSSNVVVVALADEILHSGARGFGFIEAGWAIGAILGGIITSQLPQRLRLPICGGGGGNGARTYCGAVRGFLAASHDPARMFDFPRAGRHCGAVFADVHRAETIHGPHAIGIRDFRHRVTAGDELSGLDCRPLQHRHWLFSAGRDVFRRHVHRCARPQTAARFDGIEKKCGM